MEYRAVGRTGLVVSALGLGTMTWGRDTDEMDATDQLADFLDAGGTLVDTAASYGGGAAEEQLGDLIGTVADRSDLVLTTKSGVGTRGGRAVVDASRGSLLASLEGSLRRLGTSWVDLWLVQAPDHHTPLAETLGALTLAVQSGKARYVGLSNHPAWLTAAAAAQLRHSGVELAAAEVEYSLLQRGIERELVPASAGLGFGVLAWSPLGRGVLTGKYRHSIPADSRAASAHLRGFVEPYLNTSAGAVVEAVATAADGLGVSPLAVALAWVRQAPQVACAIVGGRTAGQLRASLAAGNLELPAEIVSALGEISAPAVGYPERL
ncbi:MAG: aldo/keto reductase [Bifidobacteriaceae bacterium]|jgi:aryl-alcohol dehydrogenase-like predicted oxidoreductase|nr:aldo/keto reductase [Bifidobacteriaceae bacterium]